MKEAIDRFESILRFASERQISDVHFKAGQRPLYRRVGRLISRREEPAFDADTLSTIATHVLSGEEAAAFNRGVSQTAIYGLMGVGRFRVSVSRQRGGIALAVRVLPSRAPVLRDLRLPQPVATLCNVEAGLVLLCGGRGEGRTTTAAAMIDAINTTSTHARQICTIERPVEVIFDDKLAWIVQRGVGVDCESIAAGVRDALDSDADVVVIDEIADAAALTAVIDAAEAGKLVLAGVVALDVAATVRRLEGLVTADALPQLRARLAAQLVAMISQRLIPASDNQRLLPAVEVLLSSPQVYGILRGGHDPAALYDIMAASNTVGMQTLDQSLHDMIRARALTVEAAMPYATRPQELTTMRSKGTGPEAGLF